VASTHEHTRSEIRLPEGHAWRKAWQVFFGIGVLGLAGAAAGYMADPHRFAYAWLFGLMTVLPIGLGALFFVVIQHIVAAYWSVTLRRVAEFIMNGLPAIAVLVLPLMFVAPELYSWMHEGHEHGAPSAEHADGIVQGGAEHDVHAAAHEDHGDPASPAALAHAEHEAEESLEASVLAGKKSYLNKKGFYIRAAVYVGIWAILATLYFRFSTKQDEDGDPAHTRAAQSLAPVALILFGFSLTFAGIDWLMSLDPLWYSTIFGVYCFAMGMVSFFATLILIVSGLRASGVLTKEITVEHLHDVGKFLFGFNAFWAYIAFSQFFLIYYSSIPEEVTFFHKRWTFVDAGNPWANVSLLLVALHFVVPFVFLMSRNIKRNTTLLPIGAAILLVMHIVEVYWIVLPNYVVGPDGKSPLAPSFVDVSALLACVGIFFGVALKSLTSHSLIAARDPRIARALSFEQV
jgi:hypothetical protein